MTAVICVLPVVILLSLQRTTDNGPRAFGQRTLDQTTPVFAVRTVDGGRHTGALQRLQHDWSARMDTDTGRVEINGAEVLSLRRPGTPLPEFPRAQQLILANGDRIGGTAVKLRDERLHFRPSFQRDSKNEMPSEWTVPLSVIAVIWLAAPDNSTPAELLRRKLALGPRRRDAVLLRNGDSLEGTLTDLDSTEGKPALRIDLGKTQTTVELAKVSAVAFSTDLMQRPKPKAVYGQLVLANGGRLSVVSASIEDGTLRGETVHGGGIRVPLDEMVALSLRNGRVVYLSDLKPRRYEFTPYLSSVGWPFAVDASLTGGDIRLGGNVYDKGLALHSGGRISFDLDGKYRRFEALVGLDDVNGKQGSARARVMVDGKNRAVGLDEELTWKTGPKPVSVNLAGAKELTLAVDFGRFGDVQDHVNWADGTLIK